ncbi:MAG: osmoprotection protein (proV) [Thermodesulfobium narugense]|nr:MAG: osmoprotection protein (proV) [Thermodesulfobium narugense]
MIFKNVDSIEIVHLVKNYRNFMAIDDVSLKINGKELFVIIGPSGCGKTTLLKTINRLVEPDSGGVFINNNDIRNLDVVKLRKNIGYVIQQVGLFPHMNIKDNISLILKLEGWPREKIDKRVKEILKIVFLDEIYLRKFPNQLSGGQQQRVGLARALALNQPLLLMDEPFGSVDPILRRQLQDEFLQIKKVLGKTIVFVTHDIEEAFRLGDRIAVMKDGKIKQIGETNDLILNPADSFVLNLVESDKKYKHISNLKVRDVMIPVKNYTIDSQAKISDSIKFMLKNNIEFGIIVKEDKFLGTTDLKALLNSNFIKNDQKIENLYNKETLKFSPEKPLYDALAEMKKSNISIAVVLERDMPIGIILSSEILNRLI